MALKGAPPAPANPLTPWITDLKVQRRATSYPPGDLSWSLTRPGQMLRDPLSLLLDGYAKYGPVFTLRMLTSKIVIMLGPEANHHLLVSNAKNFSWRQGSMGNLIPLLGDGLLTIDGDFHRTSRKIMLPMFQRERIAASMDIMREEIDAGLDQWRDGQRVDIEEWTRDLALHIAMRALFGLDPHGAVVRRYDAANLFEQALKFYNYDLPMQMARGPRTPWDRMKTAKAGLDEMIYAEIRSRRSSGERGEDLLSLLMDASDEDGDQLSDRQIRDEVMTMLFAGHDTTTSTISFMFHELLHHPAWISRLRDERVRLEADGPITAQRLMSGELVELEMVLDEVLRLYPPAWVGPRRAIDAFSVCGQDVPAGAPVLYSSWVSHRLPDVWDDPESFKPERWTEDFKKSLPRGAYVPFGGGSRSCIGMRFGQLEIRTIITEALRRFDFELEPGYKLRVRQQPTIGPADGLPVRVAVRS
jgi:cytochrome P450